MKKGYRNWSGLTRYLGKESEPHWVRKAEEGGPGDQLDKEITGVGQ